MDEFLDYGYEKYMDDEDDGQVYYYKVAKLGYASKGNEKRTYELTLDIDLIEAWDVPPYYELSAFYGDTYKELGTARFENVASQSFHNLEDAIVFGEETIAKCKRNLAKKVVNAKIFD